MSYQPPTDYNPNPEWQGQQGGYGQPNYSEQPYAPPPPPPPPQPGYAPVGAYPGYAVPMAPPEPGKGLAIAGLVLGIVSLVTSLTFVLWFCASPISIVGIVLSALGRRSISRRTMATVGLVLSIVALGLSVIFAIIYIAAYSSSYHSY